MSNRKNAYKEVYMILQDLNEEEYSKIPSEIIKVLKENMNEEYEFEFDEELELKEQQMLPETKAILFNIFRDYLATPEQKNKIIKMQNEERQKNEVKKQQMYNTDMFVNKKNDDSDLAEKNTQLAQYKENIFKRILNKIKNLFNKKYGREKEKYNDYK